MKKYLLILSLFFLVTFGAKAQTYLLQEDFSALTSGNNTSTTGAGTSWTGNSNFPTVASTYQAGGVVKLGTGSGVGSITSKIMDLSGNGGNFNVSFDVKGWTTVEGSIKVTVTGLTAQTVTYTATMSSAGFENKVLSFTGGTANSTVKIETTAKRAYIDNVNIYNTISCNPSNLAFANSSFNKIIGDASFTQTATSLNTMAQVLYSSSATGVATVDSSTGLVTIVGVGSANIIANQAAADGYCATTASYTLNVTPSPTLTVTDVTNPSLSAVAGNSTNQTINISAVNLSADLGLAISGTDAGLFSLSQYHIAQTSGNVPNTLVTITYSPTVAGTHTATLTMASTGAMDVIRLISGTATIATGLDKVPSSLFVYVENNNIKFTAKSGEILEMYNSIGQKMLHSFTSEGLNTIPISTHGVVLVRVGNRQTKVIL